MPLNVISKCFLVGVPLAMFVTGIQAEQGEGTIRDPLTGKYINVYRDWQEGVKLDPTTGDYTVTYKSADGSFNEVVFVPATKIEPTFKSRFNVAEKENTISYNYRLKNAKTSKQDIRMLFTKVSQHSPNGAIAPTGWEVTSVPAIRGTDLLVSWTPIDKAESDQLSGLKPGKTQDGFGLMSNDLPGIAIMEIKGLTNHITEWLGHYPVGAVGERVEEIRKNDFIPRLAAVPKIPTGNPFDPVLTLTGIQTHLNQALVSMKLVDPVFASQLDRSLQAAIDAAKLGNTKALKDHLKDIRHMLKKEHGDIDNEGDDKDNDKPKKPGAIDKLAARVLDFDIKYIEKRISGKNDD